MPLCDFIGHSWPAHAQHCYIGVCAADASVRFVLRLPSRVSVIILLAMLFGGGCGADSWLYILLHMGNAHYQATVQVHI